ncbi:hypothetical protein BaRGS_00005165, partial [Batillaria attramentaria]
AQISDVRTTPTRGIYVSLFGRGKCHLYTEAQAWLLVFARKFLRQSKVGKIFCNSAALPKDWASRFCCNPLEPGIVLGGRRNCVCSVLKAISRHINSCLLAASQFVMRNDKPFSTAAHEF